MTLSSFGIIEIKHKTLTDESTAGNQIDSERKLKNPFCSYQQVFIKTALQNTSLILAWSLLCSEELNSPSQQALISS